MSENNEPNTANDVPIALDVEETPQVDAVPAFLKGIDTEKARQIQERVKQFTQGNKKTISGSEAPEDAPPTVAPGEGLVMTGKDVDWNEYKLEYSVRHLYPKATFRETPQGPKWVAMLDEFFSTERSFKGHGKMVNVPNSDATEPLNLGDYLSEMLNNADGWRVISMLPSSMGNCGIVLQRQIPVILPDPMRIEKETEVAAPSDPELERTEEAALGFMSTEGLTPPAPSSDDSGGEEKA